MSNDASGGNGKARLERLKKAGEALDAAQQTSKKTLEAVSRARQAVKDAKKDVAIINSGRKTKPLTRKKKR